MQNITYEGKVFPIDTPEGRKDIMVRFPAGSYVGVNESGEQITLSFIYQKSMTITTNQSNGWVRVNRYDSEGFATEETYEGRWKDSFQQEKTESPEVLSWSKLMAAIKDARRVEYEVDVAKSVLYFMSDHFGLILVEPKDFAIPMRLGKAATGIVDKLKEHLGKATDIATKTPLTYHALHDKGDQKILIGTNAEGKKYTVFIPAKLWDVVDGHETSIFTNGSIGTVVVASEVFFAFIRPTKIHNTELNGLRETLREFGGNCV